MQTFVRENGVLCKIDLNDTQEAKRYLSGYVSIKRQRDMLMQEIREYYQMATACNVNLDPYKLPGGSAIYDKMAESVCRMADAKTNLEKAIARMDAKLKEIIDVISRLDDERCKEVLLLRYVETGKDERTQALRNTRPWEEVQRIMNYESTTVKILHVRAMQKISEILKSATFFDHSDVL